MKKRTLFLTLTLLLAASTFVKAGDIPQPPLDGCDPTTQVCPTATTTPTPTPTDTPSDSSSGTLAELTAEAILYGVSILIAIKPA